MVNNKISFVPNTPDDLHCLQSSFLMVIQYFEPNFEMDWDEWSRITGYQEGLASWATAGLLWFRDRGYAVHHVDLFDYADFAKNGGDYLRREFGEEVSSWQIAHSDLPREQERAQELLEAGIIERRVPTADDIKAFLGKGYLATCLVNSSKLNGNDGYLGHSVVISGYDEGGFTIQDPGLPPQPNRYVTFEAFENAWADPHDEAKELNVFRRHK